MPDTDDGQQAAAEVKKSGSPRMRSVWGIGYIKRKFHEYKANRKDETPADKAARRTAHATIWIAVFTVVLAVASIKTLSEIQKSGADTHDLAVAAGQQAQAAILQSQRTESLATTASVQAAAAITSADAAKSAADTAAKALEASTQSFRQEERAYVSTTSFINPLVCRFPQDQGPRVCVDVHMLNDGRTPAIGAFITRRVTFGKNARQTVENLKVPAYKAASGDLWGTGKESEKFVTAITEIVDEKTAMNLVSSATPDTQMYIYGVIQYRDIFGEYHETGYCSYRVLNSTAVAGCLFGNWFDKRPKPSSGGEQQEKAAN